VYNAEADDSLYGGIIDASNASPHEHLPILICVCLALFQVEPNLNFVIKELSSIQFDDLLFLLFLFGHFQFDASQSWQNTQPNPIVYGSNISV